MTAGVLYAGVLGGVGVTGCARLQRAGHGRAWQGIDRLHEAEIDERAIREFSEEARSIMAMHLAQEPNNGPRRDFLHLVFSKIENSTHKVCVFAFYLSFELFAM
nr:TAT-variant-translocated molybdopterin oxidoreductase [Sinorhizobium medicae]